MKKRWKLEIFKDKAGACRIRLRASNGQIIMSSEAYSSQAKAVKTANRMLENTPSTIIFVSE